MTKTKTTKRALISSALVLIICIAMFVGTTFAWFTDSVTSAGNIIKSGNLDVTMEWFDGTKVVPDADSVDWIDASSEPIFDYELWEPGYVSVRHIKIANEGSLALKYQLNIVANGAVSELADVIDVYYLDPAAQVANRTALTADKKLGTLTDVLADIDTTASGNLLANTNHTVTLALKMQESAGNEYQNKAIGSTFSVQLLATQLTSEFDSFGREYDENAEYAIAITNPDEAYDATVKGGNYSLRSNIKPTEGYKTYSTNRGYAVRDDVNLVVDLNGYTIEYDKEYNGYIYLYTVAYNSTLTVNGSGTLRTVNNSNGANAETAIIYAQSTGNAVVNSGNFNPKNGIAAWAGKGAHIIIKGGNFVSDGEKKCELIYSSGGVIDIYGGFFHNTNWEDRPVNVGNDYRNTGFINIYGGTFVNFDPSTGGDDPNNIKVADGYKVVSKTQNNGDVWYTVVAK